MPDVHSTLMTSTVWPADLVTAGVVSSASQVYDGRAPQSVRRSDLEVWIEQLGTEQIGRGFQGLTRHSYSVHVLAAGPGNRGGDKTGGGQVAAVQGKLQTIADRYHGARPFSSDLPDMVCAEASVQTVDEDPEEGRWIEGVVEVSFLVRR